MTEPRFDHRGWVGVPPRVAAWLEQQAGITAALRDGLRDTDLEAHRVLCDLHAAALSVSGPNAGAHQSPGRRSNTWLSTAQAAKQAGVQDRTVRRWCDTGKLPARLQASRYLISSLDLREFLRKTERHAAS